MMQQSMAAAMTRANSNSMKGMPPGTMGPNGNQGSPVPMDPAKDMYAAGAVNGRMAMAPNPAAPGQGGQGGPTGNHALQDYQMQLMLLEQQNKKRLLMARQEQDTLGHQPGMAPNGE